YAQPCAEFVRQLKAHTRLTAREERAQEWLSDATARYRRFSALRQLREIKPRGRDLNQRQRSSSAPARAKHSATTQIHRRSEFRGVDVRFCRPLACPLWTGPVDFIQGRVPVQPLGFDGVRGAPCADRTGQAHLDTIAHRMRLRCTDGEDLSP